MEDIFDRLANRLCEENDKLSMYQARIWVEYLWEDFEATRAKAGRDYEGKQMTEQIVMQWINSYGSRLHDFMSQNPRYKHLFNDDQQLH
ncbi:YfhJ family protein [Pontibacillus salipaludis]|uniref:WVELL protein n=1 Tax=Pontibacillus salipaludis TaxID=1697394 RepID=A0ABQ1Q9V4_9BACI|nr:YfhJ family protein [Pontibacillus salipaludis]GGD20495.1 hypothetical protein GCM10011389_30180 [Pontibacillus salipaludis]